MLFKKVENTGERGGNITINGEKKEISDSVIPLMVPMGLGQLQIVLEPNGDVNVKRLSQSRKIKYEVDIHQGETYQFGPKFPNKVIQTYDETNPYKRVMRELNIPVSKLYIESKYDFFPTESSFLTDYQRLSAKGETVESNAFVKKVEENGKMVDKIFNVNILIQTSFNPYRADLIYNIEKVVVTKTADPKELKGALAWYVYGKHADYDFSELLTANGTHEMARKWICAHFDIKDNGDSISFREKDGNIHYEWKEYKKPLEIFEWEFVTIRSLLLLYNKSIIDPTPTI